MAAVFGDDYGDNRGAARGKPVAPADDEAGVIAERAAREIVLAAAAGNGGAEFGHRRGAEKSVESAGDPYTDKQPCVGNSFRNFALRSNDSRGDGISDSHSHTEPHSENLQQAAAADRGPRANCGRSFGRFRQCEVSKGCAKRSHHIGEMRKCKLEVVNSNGLRFERIQRRTPTKFHLPQAKDSWTRTKCARTIFRMRSGWLSHCSYVPRAN